MSLAVFVYKVLTPMEWELFKKKKKFEGNNLDIKSGFIHLSKKKQINNTIANYFSEYRNLIIAEFEVSNLNKFLKWEISRNNEVFPHYYSTLNYNDINGYEIFKNIP